MTASAKPCGAHRVGSRRWWSSAALLATAVLVAGCAQQSSSPALRPNTVGLGGHYPVTVDNCGRSVTFAQAPRRVFLGFQSAAELFFGLRLGDKAIAKIAPVDPPLPEQAGDFARVPNRSRDGYLPVGKEQMLQLHPDLLLAYVNGEYGGPDNRAPGLATVADLASIAANVYAVVCPNDNPVRIDLTYRAVDDLGRIFGIEATAREVTDRMRARIADVQRRVAGRPAVPVLFYFGGTGPVTTASRDAIMDEMIRLAGGENVFGSVGGGRRGFLDVALEEVAAKNPAVFLISAGSADQRQARADFLYRNFPWMPASRDRKVVVTNDSADAPGWRVVSVVENLARTLHPDAFADISATAAGVSTPH